MGNYGGHGKCLCRGKLSQRGFLGTGEGEGARRSPVLLEPNFFSAYAERRGGAQDRGRRKRVGKSGSAVSSAEQTAFPPSDKAGVFEVGVGIEERLVSLIKLLDCKRLGPGGAQVGDVLIHLRARVCATRHEVGIYPPSCGRITGRGDVEHGAGVVCVCWGCVCGDMPTSCTAARVFGGVCTSESARVVWVGVARTSVGCGERGRDDAGRCEVGGGGWMCRRGVCIKEGSVKYVERFIHYVS